MSAQQIRGDNLFKVFGGGTRRAVTALNGVSISWAAGASVALVGPSGSGKSTLVSLLGGLARPTRGSVQFRDRDLATCSDFELARLRRSLGFLFQSESLIPALKAWQNVSYPLVAQGVCEAERRQRAEALLNRLNLSDRAEAFPDELSGGEQQRVAAARALVADPEVVFADEPTAHLDAAASEQLASLFASVRDEGTTIIVATHDPLLVEAADRVVHLDRGRIVDG